MATAAQITANQTTAARSTGLPAEALAKGGTAFLTEFMAESRRRLARAPGSKPPSSIKCPRDPAKRSQAVETIDAAALRLQRLKTAAKGVK